MALVQCFIATHLLSVSSPVAAQATYWKVASGDWSAAGNWTGGVPTSTTEAWITNGGSATISAEGATCFGLHLGSASGNESVQMTGGSLFVKGPQIGQYGPACFTQSGGTFTVDSSFSLRVANGAQYQLNGGALGGGWEILETADFNQAGGTNQPSLFFLGYSAGSRATYSLRAAGQLTASRESLGQSGAGVFTHDGGSNRTQSLYIGTQAGSSGSYVLNGGDLFVEYGAEVGDSGTGVFTQWNGTHTMGSTLGNVTLCIGNAASSVGTYYLHGGSVSGAFFEKVGSRGIGTFVQTGGSNTTSILELGFDTGSQGTYNLSGGTLETSSIMGGTGTATFSFNGGVLRTGPYFTTALPIGLNTAGGDATIDTAGNSARFTGALSGPGNLIKTGGGTLTLSAVNTYSGPTNISYGTLQLSGAGSLSSSPITMAAGTTLDVSTVNGGYHLNTGQILAGTGKEFGDMTVDAGAHIAPGDTPGSIGTLYIGGTLTLASGSKLDFDLGGSGTNDRIVGMSSLVTFDGQEFSDFTFASCTGFGRGVYTLVSAQSIQGALGADRSGLIDGLDASISISGGKLILTVVPEPSTVVLLGLGVTGAVGCMWRRRKVS